MLSWVTLLAELGQHKQLDADDLWPLRAAFQAEPVANKIARACSDSMLRAFLV